MNLKKGLFLLTVACILATAIACYFLGGIEPKQIQIWLQEAGIWAPIAYVVIYIIATLLILPSTALNLTGGAIFGVWWGTFWTSLAAILAAITAFSFTRTVGREMVSQRLSATWQTMDGELRQGGLFYLSAIRLLPIIPYGLVNFAAGLTSISFKDYCLGTALGTIPGILPFVWLGSSGLQAFQTGDILPVMVAIGLIGMLVGSATWYQRRRTSPVDKLQKNK